MGNPIWRSVLWIERFLPKPKTPAAQTEQALEARRRAAYLPLVVVPFVLLPGLLRNWRELGAILRQNVVVAEQILIGIAILCVLTVAVAGIATWRRETLRRGNLL